MSGKSKHLQKILLAASVFYIMMFSFLITVAAKIDPGTIPEAGQIGIQQESPVRDVPGLVGTVADIVSWTYTIFFAVAVIFILFAAFNYLTAQGQPEKIQTAHKMLIWAVVAIVVALLAVGVNTIVKNFLEEAGGGAPQEDLRIPSETNPFRR